MLISRVRHLMQNFSLSSIVSPRTAVFGMSLISIYRRQKNFAPKFPILMVSHEEKEEVLL